MDDNFSIRSYTESDLEGMLAIFNYFAEEGYAVYCDFPLNTSQFKKLTEQIRIGLVIESEKKIIGFGYISYYKSYPNFDKTGVLTYFILPEYTGKGLGSKLFNELIAIGKKSGITNYLAHISSRNIQSLNFHKKHGFKEAGIFKNVAAKFNEPFDIVWVQKQYNN